MFLFQQAIFRRLCIVCVLTLCLLPGCGGGSTSTVATDRALKQQFYGINTAGATYTVEAPIDQSKPVTVTVGGSAQMQGKDYFIDQTFPNIVHLYKPVPADTLVDIAYSSHTTAQ